MSPWRYPRLYLAFARFDLASEMSFRVNFVAKLSVELLWLFMLVMFYELIFQRTNLVAGWDRNRYLFFVGCFYALGGLIEAFFLENCLGFAELVRTGDLDTYLLKPIDEQFLITCRHVDWSTLPNIAQGIGVMIYALASMEDWTFNAGRLLAFVALFACGCAMAYSFLLTLCSLSVWMVRNQSLMEMWWLFTTLMRYPREIFHVQWANPVGWFFTFIVPVLLVVSVPSETMVRALRPGFIAWMVVAAAGLLYLSRKFFRRALGAYRSASS
jgi:ABC-2 type transport system permease protein